MFWVFHSPLITVIEDWINLSVPEIIIQSFWFWCCFQTDYCQQTCNPSLLWNFSCITRLHKVIWLNQCISNKSCRADIEEQSLKKVLCNIQINMQPHFGNSCCRDVRGGYDWRNFYSESSQTCTPVVHLFMLYSEKHTSAQHNRFPAMLDVILIPKRFSWPVFHVPAVIGAGQQCITGSQRYGRQRALERVERQTETTHIDRHLVKYNRKSGKQTAVQRGHNVFLLFFFISPFRKKSSVLFDIRPTCSSDEHKSGVECVWEPSPIVCSALSDPRVHVDTHSLSCLSLSVIKQRAVAGLYERAVPFSTSPTHAG